MMGVEKRKFSRKDDCVCTWLSFTRDPAAYSTTTVDLGMEGARFIVSKPVEVGERLQVCLQLPSMNVECNGTVCWQDGDSFMLGVQFLNLRNYERDLLMHYLCDSDASTVKPQTEMMADSMF